MRFRLVRQRLTEPGLTYTIRQVPVERDARPELEHATGRRTIPVVVAGATVIDGERAIPAYLDEHYTEPPDASQQRANAAKAKQRDLRKHVRRRRQSRCCSYAWAATRQPQAVTSPRRHISAPRLAAESGADADELLVDTLVDPIATELGDVSSGATGHTMAGYESSS